jgi:hypothetical protein
MPKNINEMLRDEVQTYARHIQKEGEIRSKTFSWSSGAYGLVGSSPLVHAVANEMQAARAPDRMWMGL